MQVDQRPIVPVCKRFPIPLGRIYDTKRNSNRCSHDSNVYTYSREQFLQIAVKVCRKLLETALIIAEERWEQQGDIRDVVSLISWLRNMMAQVRSLKLLRRW